MTMRSRGLREQIRIKNPKMKTKIEKSRTRKITKEKWLVLLTTTRKS
jgi:hypothetical protein